MWVLSTGSDSGSGFHTPSCSGYFCSIASYFYPLRYTKHKDCKKKVVSFVLFNAFRRQIWSHFIVIMFIAFSKIFISLSTLLRFCFKESSSVMSSIGISLGIKFRHLYIPFTLFASDSSNRFYARKVLTY